MSRYNFSNAGADVSEALTKLMADRKTEARQEMLDKYAREEQVQRMENATEYTRGLKAQREGVEKDREQADVRNELSMFAQDESIPPELRQRVEAAKLGGLITPGTAPQVVDEPVAEQEAANPEPISPPVVDGEVAAASPGIVPGAIGADTVKPKLVSLGEAPTRRETPDERKQQDVLKRQEAVGKKLIGVTDRQQAARIALEEGVPFGEVDNFLNAYMGPKPTAAALPPSSVQEFQAREAMPSETRAAFDKYQNEEANRREQREPRAPWPIVIQGPQGATLVDRVSGIGTPVKQGPGGDNVGFAPTTEMRNRGVAAGRARPVLTAIGGLSEKINTGSGLIAKMTGGASKLAAQANYDDDVAEYESLVSGFTPLVARAVGHVGVLTELDVQSVRKMFPMPGDSKSLRDRKIARLNSLFEEINAPNDADPKTTEETPEARISRLRKLVGR